MLCRLWLVNFCKHYQPADIVVFNVKYNFKYNRPYCNYCTVVHVWSLSGVLLAVHYRSRIPEVPHQPEFPVNTDSSTHIWSIMLLGCYGSYYCVWVQGVLLKWKVTSDFLFRNPTSQTKQGSSHMAETNRGMCVFVCWFGDFWTKSHLASLTWVSSMNTAARMHLVAYVFLTPSSRHTVSLSVALPIFRW